MLHWCICLTPNLRTCMISRTREFYSTRNIQGINKAVTTPLLKVLNLTIKFCYLRQYGQFYMYSHISLSFPPSSRPDLHAYDVIGQIESRKMFIGDLTVYMCIINKHLCNLHIHCIYMYMYVHTCVCPISTIHTCVYMYMQN